MLVPDERPPGGWVEMIVGPMFSGKTEELIRRVRSATSAGLETEVFKPRLDDRYHPTDVVSHSQQALPAVAVEDPAVIIQAKAKVIGIDEVQFFSSEVVSVVESLADQGRRVIVAGLHLDYRARPFGAVPELMARAEFVTKLLAVCIRCGGPAARSHRISTSRSTVEVGAEAVYEPVCRRCFRSQNCG